MHITEEELMYSICVYVCGYVGNYLQEYLYGRYVFLFLCVYYLPEYVSVYMYMCITCRSMS